MIPILAALRFGRRRLLWIPIPLFLVWLLLLPLCLLALPFYFVACRKLELPAGRTLVTGLGLLRGLRGIHLEIDVPDVRMALRLI